MSASYPDCPNGWRIFPTGLLRSAGLPFRWLDMLADARLEDLARSVLVAEETVLTARASTLNQVKALIMKTDGDERRALRRASRRVMTLRPVPVEQRPAEAAPALAQWADALDAFSTVEARVEQELHAAASRELEILMAHVRQGYFTDTVMLSSPDVYDELRRTAARNGFRRGRETVAYRFLQRFCGKNETGGQVGPLNLVTIGSPADGSSVPATVVHEDPVLGPLTYLPRGDGRAANRRTFMAYWAATAVGNAVLTENGTAHTIPRRVIGPAPDDLDDVDARVLAAVDGTGGRSALAAALGLGEDVVEASLARLVERKLILDDWHVSDFTTDAGAELRALVGGLDGESARQAGELLDGIERFASTGLVDRPAMLAEITKKFSALTRCSPWRGAGGLMTDRAVFYEEAVGNIENARITADGAARLVECMSTALDLLASLAVESRLEGQRLLADELRRRGLSGLPAAEARAVPTGGADAERRYERRLVDLLDARKTVVELDRADLVRAGLIRDDLDDWPLFGAVDLMLTGDRPGDEPQIILSELHHIWPTLACQVRALYTDEQLGNDELHRIVTRELASALPTLQQVSRDQKGTDSSPYGHRVLCLDTDTPVPGAVTVPLDRAEVRRWPNGLIGLHDPAAGTDLWLLPEYEDTYVEIGGLMNCALPALELPRLTAGAHTPRIVIDGVVLQRRRWHASSAEVPGIRGHHPSVGEWRAIMRWRHDRDLPRQVYFIVDTEEKPVYLDFASIVSVRNFCRMVARARHVVLSEALPDPDQLWLRTLDGRLTSELRFQVWRDRAVGGTRVGAPGGWQS
ncbi:hypothetical protein [Micromonospora haikouensis]|nr:hypothetical protein [Micromonospora haikouensis]